MHTYVYYSTTKNLKHCPLTNEMIKNNSDIYNEIISAICNYDRLYFCYELDKARGVKLNEI